MFFSVFLDNLMPEFFQKFRYLSSPATVRYPTRLPYGPDLPVSGVLLMVLCRIPVEVRAVVIGLLSGPSLSAPAMQGILVGPFCPKLFYLSFHRRRNIWGPGDQFPDQHLHLLLREWGVRE